MTKTDRERSLAMFVDLENLAMGFQNQRKTKFDITKVLERLVEKGKLIVKKAYADWSRYQAYTAPFHEAAIELIEIPRRSQTGKNSADIRLVVDAMDLAWSKPHVDTFVIVSGDSDFSPLVSKLKENGKHVIGLGMKGSTSELLRDNCDEFIYYEDLERQEQDEQQLATNLYADMPDRKREVYTLLVEACNALRRENHEILYASMIKDTMKRKKPSFDESYYGYRSFTHLLEEADNQAIVDIERNHKSGTYVVTHFGEREAPKVEGERPAGRRPSLDPAGHRAMDSQIIRATMTYAFSQAPSRKKRTGSSGVPMNGRRFQPIWMPTKAYRTIQVRSSQRCFGSRSMSGRYDRRSIAHRPETGDREHQGVEEDRGSIIRRRRIPERRERGHREQDDRQPGLRRHHRPPGGREIRA